MGQYARGHHPASRSNLVPFTGAGDPNRHCGAPSIGRSIAAMMNELARDDDDGNALYDEEQLRKIASDPKLSYARVVAASELLRGRLQGFDKIGRIPQAANSIDRIMDRTDGKPVQTLRVEREPSRPAAEIRAEIAAFIAANPELVEGFEPPINTTAVEIDLSVPEKKPPPPLIAAAKAQEEPAEDRPEPKGPPEPPKRPDRPVADDISAWI